MTRNGVCLSNGRLIFTSFAERCADCGRLCISRFTRAPTTRFLKRKLRNRKRRDPIRIVERFQTRRTPQIIPADFVTEKNHPRVVEQTEKWKPNQGADVLHQRYSEKFEDDADKKFPLMKPDDAEESAIWESFALEVFGFRAVGRGGG